MPATFSLPHLLVFSTLLCLVSSSSSLPPLLPSSHLSLHRDVKKAGEEGDVCIRAGTNTPSDEYDTYRDTGWRIRYVSRIHFFSEAKLGNG